MLDVIEQDDALSAICRAAGANDVLLATTGYTGRALYAQGDAPNQFYMVGSMGCLSSFALGLALARPKARVVAIEGDGAVLMRMGAMAAIGHQRPENLVHIMLDNGVHDSTGAQATVSSSVDFTAVARACNYARAIEVCGPSELQKVLRQDHRELTFIYARTCLRGNRNLPRPKITPPEVARRFRDWLEVTC
jgi:phosphonopyruvate decarboxylase